MAQSMTTAPKRRAAVACRMCNIRKVRCNVDAVGRPCANCASDNIECEIPPRKRIHKSISSKGEPHVESTTTEGSRTPTVLSPQVHKHSNPRPAQSSPRSRGSKSSAATQPPGASADSEDFSASLDFSDALGKGRESFFNTGPHDRGPLGQVSDEPNAKHLPAARYFASDLRRLPREEEDVFFLRAKGVFALPSPSVYDQLIVSFFHNVYPLVPILDAKAFLELYEAQGCSGPSVLLLWSMFVTATNHVSIEVVEEAGYESRAAMKKQFFERAKTAFDQAIEHNPITILQSVTILGFGVMNPRDQFHDWHWLGIAISMCLNLRVHRSMTPENMTNSGMTIDQFHVRTRIWWTCVVRDRFLALLRNRPVRINLQDSSLVLPVDTRELSDNLRAVPEHLRSKYLPFDLQELGDLWGKWVRYGVILGKIIHHRSHRTTARVMSDIADEIHSASPSQTAINEGSQLCQRLIALEVKLLHGALTILLNQPAVFEIASSSESVSPDLQNSQAMMHSAEAASMMNGVLQELMRLSLLPKITPIFMAALIPAMQVHLLHSRSQDPGQSRLGYYNLDLYLMALSEIRHDYWGAELAFQLFNRAISQPTGTRKSPETIATVPEIDSTTAASAEPLTHPTPVSIDFPLDLPLPGLEWDETNTIFSSLFDNTELNAFFQTG